jgi:ribosome maturation factor RimP
MLRIYIDKPGGVTHEDCANFSREAGTIFDVEDAVPGGSYTLEVSSPGLDRKLSTADEFERFVGSLVKVTTRDPINGNRHFEGRLKAFQDTRLWIELSGRKKSKKHEGVETGSEVEIQLSNVEKANLVPEI